MRTRSWFSRVIVACPASKQRNQASHFPSGNIVWGCSGHWGYTDSSFVSIGGFGRRICWSSRGFSTLRKYFAVTSCFFIDSSEVTVLKGGWMRRYYGYFLWQAGSILDYTTLALFRSALNSPTGDRVLNFKVLDRYSWVAQILPWACFGVDWEYPRREKASCGRLVRKRLWWIVY